jgi:hypothetical protein
MREVSRDAATPSVLRFTAFITVAVLAVIALLATVEVFDPIRTSDRTERASFLLVAIGFLGAAVLVAAVARWRPRLLGPVLIVWTLAYGPLLVVNIIVARQMEDTSIPGRARSIGLEFDARTQPEVVRDARRKDPGVYPSTSPSSFIRTDVTGWPPFISVDGKDVLPMGGVAAASVVACNESGTWETWRFDRFGLHNPDSIWNAQKFDVVIVGDSFAEGACMPEGSDIASLLRGAYPGTVTLGRGGAGPLLELAVLREFTGGRKSDYVFWVFYEEYNLHNIAAEFKHPVLNRYLEPGFTQRLPEMQGAVDAALRKLVDERLEASRQALGVAPSRFRKIVQTVNSYTCGEYVGKRIRQMRAGNTTAAAKVATSEDIEKLRIVAGLMKSEASRLGARLVFVYIPRWPYDGKGNERATASKQPVLDLAASFGLPTIDIEALFRSAGGNQTQFYSVPWESHYSLKGYTVIADELTRFMQEDP